MERVRNAVLLVATFATLAVVLVSLLTFVAVEAALLLLVGAVSRLGHRGRHSRVWGSSGRVVEGEYTVLASPPSSAHRPRD